MATSTEDLPSEEVNLNKEEETENKEILIDNYKVENEKKKKKKGQPIPERLSVEVGQVSEFYESWKAAETQEEKEDWLIKIFNAHQFVKKKRTVETIFENIKSSVAVTGYSLEVWKFQKWLKKPANRDIKKLAGGVSDDGLYTVSTILRNTMPRGFHTIALQTPEGNKRICFRGIKKFTGMTSHDEDEESNSTSVSFFYDGKTSADASFIFQTEKSNGENAKIGCAIVGEIPFLISGSKNTCCVWPAFEDPLSYYPQVGIKVPSPFINQMYSKWFLGLEESIQQRWLNEVSQFGTIMGEINLPWSEHIVPINEIFLELYCILDYSGKPIQQQQSFEFFESFNIMYHPKLMKQPEYDVLDPEQSISITPVDRVLRHVFFERYPINELEPIIDTIRLSKNTEGSVIYMCDVNENVIGLVKVKANEYVWRRRLREKLKNRIFQPLALGAIEGFMASKKSKNQQKRYKKDTLENYVKQAKGKIKQGMNQFSWIPNHLEYKDKWIEFSLGFLDFWIEEKLLSISDATKSDLENLLRISHHRIASLYWEYEQTLDEENITN